MPVKRRRGLTCAAILTLSGFEVNETPISFKRCVYSIALLFPILLTCVAADWNDRNTATGSWGGIRSRIEKDYGLHFDLAYTAESFGDSGNNPTYRGNIDFAVTIDTKKLRMWRAGTIFVYAEEAHGGGVSRGLGLIVPVSNLDAKPFLELSEYWLYQQIGDRLHLRLGKQDGNRDFGSPRFPGNFINSSYGAVPGVPMPTFPAPGLGAVAFINVAKWLEVRSGLYEGEPKISSFAQSAFAGGGVFAISALVLHQDLPTIHQSSQFGVWTHTHEDRTGVFALYDVLLLANSHNPKDNRSVQLFIRGAWSPKSSGESVDEITAYAGGGVTVHGFLGRNNTFGFGAGRARTAAPGETLVEVFFKIRSIEWLTFEPDFQLSLSHNNRHGFFGVRTKLKI